MMTIHQPSSQIYDMMDYLVLLHHGRVLYQGQADALPGYFAERGYPVPENHNPSDHMVDIAQTHSVETLSEAGFYVDFPPDDAADWERASKLKRSIIRRSSMNMRSSSSVIPLHQLMALEDIEEDLKKTGLDKSRLSMVASPEILDRVGPMQEYREVLKRER